MQQKYAAIDIGTNSVRLLISKVVENEMFDRQKAVTVTRIGKDVDKTKQLSRMRMHATTEAISTYVKAARMQHIENIYLFATSAVRDAENRDEFLALVKNETDLDIDIISGKAEAQLGFLGVIQGNRPKQNVLVVDIGGGSTEIVLGTPSGEIIYSHSFDMGAVRMTDRFNIGHKMQLDEMACISANVSQFFKQEDLLSKLSTPFTVVGIGGTASTAAAIALKMETYDGNKLNDYIMPIGELENVANLLTTSARDEKLKLKGLHPKRVDIIAAGVWILKSILDYLNIDSLNFSDYDNLEGAIWHNLNK